MGFGNPLKGERKRHRRLTPQAVLVPAGIFFPAFPEYGNRQFLREQRVQHRLAEIITHIGIHRIHAVHKQRKLSGRKFQFLLLKLL